MSLSNKTPGLDLVAVVALALGVGCGGGSNDPNGPQGDPITRAGSGGQSGASSRAGSGGRQNQSGTGGAIAADAGGIGGAAGSSGAGGGGSEPPVPEGCPEITPIAAPGQVIGIQSVHFGRSEVVLRNVSDVQQTIIGGRQGWQWCNVPGYWAVVIAEENVVLAPGETYTFHLIERDATLRLLYDGEDAADTNELGIYTTTGAFNNPELIEAFVSWGAGSSFETRESTASMGEKWSYGSRVQVEPGDAGFVATGDARTGDGFTSVPDRCLPLRD